MDREQNTNKTHAYCPSLSSNLAANPKDSQSLFTVQPVWQVIVSYGVFSLLNVELFIYHNAFEIYCVY